MTSLHSPTSHKHQYISAALNPYAKNSSILDRLRNRTVVIERKASTFRSTQSLASSSFLSLTERVTYGVGFVLICRPPGPPKALMSLISKAPFELRLSFRCRRKRSQTPTLVPQILTAHDARVRAPSALTSRPLHSLFVQQGIIGILAN